LYQTSCFFIVRKNVFENVKWDETKLVYADRQGGIPEDVQYSLDLVKKGYIFSFNKDALVWHYDDSYTEHTVNNISVCMKKDVIKKMTNTDFFLDRTNEFDNLLQDCENE
jgi:GT2 family glycosyltransferase